MRSVTLKKLALAFVGLTIVFQVTGIAMVFISTEPLPGGSSESFYPALSGATQVIYLSLSILILSRNPQHRIGWLFLLVGFFIALQFFGLALNYLGLPASFRLARVVDVLSRDAWIPSWIIPITLVLQLFPDGRLPSRQWWPITLATILGMGFLYAGFILHPWPWPEVNIYDCCNPLAVAAGESFFESLNWLSSIFLLVAVIGSLASVVTRYRRSVGTERAQMKWLVYTAGLVISLLVVVSIAGYADTPVFSSLFLSIPVLLAIAIGIAIRRYRLFDIDIIIRRTLQYGLLTGSLVLLYFGGILILQRLLAPVIMNVNSPLITVITTLVIAALFNPLRIRIQDFIDRQFFRKKYDAEKALNALAIVARDEVDIERLSGALLSLVDETMQPNFASLWLREDTLRGQRSSSTRATKIHNSS